MAIAFVADMGAGSSKVSGTAVLVGDQYVSGELIVVQVAMDNTGNGSQTGITVADDNGLTFTQVGSTVVTAVAAGNGAAIATFYAIAAVTDAAVTITATFGAAITAKAIRGTRYTVGAAIVAASAGSTTGVGAGANSVSGIVVPASGTLIVAGTAIEDTASPTDDADTLEGSWSASLSGGTAGGGGATNMRLFRQHKITSGTSAQTFNTGAPASDFATHVATFVESTPRHQAYTLHRRQALHRAVR